MVVNPAWRLVWALSTLKDANDHITLDGYMEHMKPLSDEEWKSIDAVPMEFEAMRQKWGLERWINGLDDHAARRRYFGEPTITICGIHSGYEGEGSKTVLPAVAVAKLDFRLVNGLTAKLAQDMLASRRFAVSRSKPGRRIRRPRSSQLRNGRRRSQPGYVGQNADHISLVRGQRPHVPV
jgi:hypothetical protein